MKKYCLFFSLFLVMPFLLFSAGFDIGGEIVGASNFTLNTENPANSEFGGSVSLAPLFIAEAEGISCTAEPIFIFDCAAGSAELSLRSLTVESFLFNFLQIKAGKYNHLPGKGYLGTCTNYFHQMDLNSFFSGSPENSYSPAYLAEIAAFPGNWYVRALASLYPVTPQLPDPGSLWFPWAKVPESITIEYDGQIRELALADVKIDETETAGPFLKNISLSAEFGGAFSFFDFSCHYYHGIDNTMVLKTRLDFPSGFLRFYDLILSPKITVIDAFGINSEAMLGGLQLWSTASFVPSKTLATRTFAELTQANLFDEVKYLEYTGGASYTFQYPSIYIAAEARHAWAFPWKEDLVMPFYHSLAGGLVSADFFSGSFSAGAVYLLSLSDFSSSAVLSAVYRPLLELEVRFYLPLFFGKAGTDFGMYKENFTAGLSFSFFF